MILHVNHTSPDRHGGTRLAPRASEPVGTLLALVTRREDRT